MRCLHVLSGDLWAGAEVSATHLVSEQARRPGIEVRAIVLNPGTLLDRLASLGIPTVVLPESRLSFLRIVRLAGETVRAFRPDVIHTHRYKEHVIGATLSMAGGACHVRSAHGAQPSVEWTGRLEGLGALLDDALADWTGSTWIAVSRDLARRIPGLRRRVHFVPNGLPREGADADRGSFAREFADDGGRSTGFVGRLERVKRPIVF
jgi:hypothetical protein